MRNMGPDLTPEELKRYTRGMIVAMAIMMRDEEKAPALAGRFADLLKKADKENLPKQATLIAYEEFEAEYFKNEPPLTEEEMREAAAMTEHNITLFDVEDRLFRPEEPEDLPPN